MGTTTAARPTTQIACLAHEFTAAVTADAVDAAIDKYLPASIVTLRTELFDRTGWLHDEPTLTALLVALAALDSGSVVREGL